LTVNVALPLVTGVSVPLVFQYAFGGAEVISLITAGVDPPVPPVPVEPPTPPAPSTQLLLAQCWVDVQA
jgi:hypothetical protein